MLRALLRSEPMTDRALLDRFATLVSASGDSRAPFDCVRMHGGVLANALALPSLRQSSVALHRHVDLPPRPRSNGRHLRARDRPPRVLRSHADAAPPDRQLVPDRPHLCRDTSPSSWCLSRLNRRLPAIACTAAVAIALVLRGRHRQRNETASDVRAVELTRRSGALARALTALHAIARVPRRWDRQREQQATHPSLARRIRDIHAAAGRQRRRRLENPAAFRAARGEAVVTFDKAQLHWQDAPGTTHVLEYGTLSELRLQVVAARRREPGRGRADGTALDDADAPGGRGGPAVDAGRRGRRMVDHDSIRSGEPPFPRRSRVSSRFGCVLAMVLGQFALALVTIWRHLRRSRLFSRRREARRSSLRLSCFAIAGIRSWRSSWHWPARASWRWHTRGGPRRARAAVRPGVARGAAPS